MPAAALVVAAIVALCSAPLGAGPALRLTPAEARGKVIYTTGRSASGKRLAYRIASGGEYLPANGVGCANCHGDDAKGREGDVLSPPITRETLSRPFTARRGRSRSPYTDALLARAITEGIDPSDNTLNPAMPRWALATSELQDLLAYLRRLKDE